MANQPVARDTMDLASIKTVSDAADASQTLLAQMQQAASDAGTSLEGIYQDAKDAETAAGTAKSSADSALSQLGTVQDVVGVLNWMLTHGRYTKATETEVDANEKYFEVSVTTVHPSANPHEQGYFELSNGIYTMTLDTTVVSGKAYYMLDLVQNPTGNPYANGYVKCTNMNDVVADYINMHLALTDEGLFVLKDDNGWKVNIKNDGLYITDNRGVTVAKYKDAITLGNDALTHAKIDSDGLHLFEGSDMYATFESGYARIGLQAENNILLNNYGMRLIGEGGTSGTYETIVDIGGVNRSSGRSPYLTLGTRDPSSSVTDSRPGRFSATFGENLVARGKDSVAEGYSSIAEGDNSHAEGQSTWASADCSHAEGRSTGAFGLYAHAEGYWTEAGDGVSCHGAHAEGTYTHARGSAAHAEGNDTYAKGNNSHAQNLGTIASSDNQTAIGRYNESDGGYDNYSLIIGNGTDADTRSNALTVDWLGEVQLYLDVDSSASKTTAATSGADKDLFNAIRALGWYDDVIS